VRRAGALLLLAACGLGPSGGGHEAVPSNGLGPFAKLPFDVDTPIEEPVLVADPDATLGDPAVLAEDGGWSLYFTRRVGDGPHEIWTVRLTSLTAPPPPPRHVFASGAAPSIVRADDGTLLLYHNWGQGIAREHSTDGGATWNWDGVVLLHLVDPAVLILPGQVVLYAGRPDGGAIVRAVSYDGGRTFPGTPEAVLLPSPDPAAFDHVAVRAPEVQGGRTVAGQLHVKLYWQGENAGGKQAIGSAGSADGRTFTRFFGGEPVVLPAEGDERAPAVALEPDRAVLFYVEGGAIAAATAP
jgi:hypothetical protein